MSFMSEFSFLLLLADEKFYATLNFVPNRAGIEFPQTLMVTLAQEPAAPWFAPVGCPNILVSSYQGP